MEPPSKALAHLTGDHHIAGLLDYLRRLFGFLVDVYGCVELPPSAESELRLANASTLVVVRSEWEGPWIAFDRAFQPVDPEDGALPLWVVMVIRNSKYGIWQSSMPSIDRFVEFAHAIPECADDILRGDFTIEPEVERFCRERARQRRERERRLDLDSAISRADAAFRGKDFRGVVAHLSSHEAELSPAQKAKLAYACRRLSGSP